MRAHAQSKMMLKSARDVRAKAEKRNWVFVRSLIPLLLANAMSALEKDIFLAMLPLLQLLLLLSPSSLNTMALSNLLPNMVSIDNHPHCKSKK